MLNTSVFMNYPHPQPLSLGERGAFNSCPLSPRERARVRANLAIHTQIQQRLFFISQLFLDRLLAHSKMGY
jgi:hypothetical protein